MAGDEHAELDADHLGRADRGACLSFLARQLAIGQQHFHHCGLGEPNSLYSGECSAPLNLSSSFEDFVDAFQKLRIFPNA